MGTLKRNRGFMKQPNEVDVGDLVWFRRSINLPLANIGLVTEVWVSRSGGRRLIRYIEVIHEGKILPLYSGMFEIISSRS